MMKNTRSHRMCAHTMYLNCWSSCDDERRAVMAYARCSWWGMAKPPTVSLSTTTTKQSFSRSPLLFFFSEDVYILLASSLVIIIHIPTNNNVLLLLLLLLLLLRRSFVQREREKRRGTKRRHTNTDERSLCALRSQFRSRESKTRFIFVFFCLGFLYQKNP